MKGYLSSSTVFVEFMKGKTKLEIVWRLKNTEAMFRLTSLSWAGRNWLRSLFFGFARPVYPESVQGQIFIAYCQVTTSYLLETHNRC